MLKKRGIALNTFIFTSLIISVVIIISFGILYVVLPDYYLYTKQNMLAKNSDDLAQSIKSAKNQSEISGLISEFSSLNNAIVMVYNNQDEIIFELSSPFSFIDFSPNKGQNFTVNIKVEKIFQEQNKETSAEFNDIDPEVNEAFSNKNLFILKKPTLSINVQKDIGVMDISHITVNGTIQPISEAKNVIISLMPYLLIIDIVIAFIAAFFYSKLITKPILSLSKTARHMQELTPGIASNIRTDDEIGELSENLDLLYQKLCSNIENLQNEMDKVFELEKSKADFMRAASHELKTPVSALNGIVEGMIDNVGKYKDRDRYLPECKKLIGNLTELLREILNASKVQITESIIKSEEVSLSELIESSLENNKLFIEDKKLGINYKKEDYTIFSDKNLLSTSVSNIVSNAVKYTDEKGVINIYMAEHDGLYIISVENECGRISETELQKLLEPFYTRNYSRNRNKSGTGLGLYIVKRNLERLGISYKLENTAIGLKFSIYLKKTAL